MAFARPERLAGIVLVNSAGGPMTDAEQKEWAARRAAAQQVADSPEAAIERTMHEIFADPSRVPATFRDDLRWQMAHAAPGQFQAAADEFVNIARAPYDQLRVPTLVVWGEADSMIPAGRGQRLAEAIPGARYVGLPGVGHTCQVEAPAEFVAAVAPFLDQLAAYLNQQERGNGRRSRLRETSQCGVRPIRESGEDVFADIDADTRAVRYHDVAAVALERLDQNLVEDIRRGVAFLEDVVRDRGVELDVRRHIHRAAHQMRKTPMNADSASAAIFFTWVNPPASDRSGRTRLTAPVSMISLN